MKRILLVSAAFGLNTLGEILILLSKPFRFVSEALWRVGNRLQVEAWLLKHQPRIFDR